jgi:hypothetical protein
MSKNDENLQEEFIERKDFLKYVNVIIDYFVGPLQRIDLKWMQEDLVNVLIGLRCSGGIRKEILATVLYFMEVFRNKWKKELMFGTLCVYMVVFYDIIHKFECDKYETMWRYSIIIQV